MPGQLKAVKSEAISVQKIDVQHAEFTIVGNTPLIINRVSEKAKRELLMPAGPKNRAQRETSLKHDPVAEFRAAPYLSESPSDPTYIVGSAMWFKNGMKTAALRIPGATKTEIGQLAFVQAEYVPIWGVPELLMSVVRSADINRTPDIRTRCILREWATVIRVDFVSPNLNLTSVTNLLAGAGIISGAGDWRNEKGAGSFGQYRIVAGLEADEPDADFLRIVASGGYDQQVEAMENPRAYDASTREMLEWFDITLKERGRMTAEKAEAAAIARAVKEAAAAETESGEGRRR